jgi:hypothetical protein
MSRGLHCDSVVQCALLILAVATGSFIDAENYEKSEGRLASLDQRAIWTMSLAIGHN